MSDYSKEIPEWSNSDLISFFNTNNLRSIASKMQNNLLTGFDLFYLTLKDLKKDLGITDYHDRLFAYREIRKLTLQHLKLTIIYEGEYCLISLDNDIKLQLSQLLNYIAAYFEANDILIKDAMSVDIISPNVQIVELMIISPEKYKTLNISRMRDKNIMTIQKNYRKMLPNNDKVLIQTNHKKKNSYTNDIIQDNNVLDQFNTTMEKNNNYNTRQESNNINYSSNYFSNKPILNNNSNRERNSFTKTSKGLQPQKSIGNNNSNNNSCNPINILNNTNNNTKNNSLYTNNTLNRTTNMNILQSNDTNPYIKNHNKYNSTYTNNDLLLDPMDTNSSNANNYFLNPNTSETTKMPIGHNNNAKDQKGFKDNDKMTLNLKDNPIEVRYKSEKRIYRQHEPNTESNIITANLLKSGNYLGTEKSIENDEYLFYNNANRKNNNSNSTPNIVNYSECSNNLNYNNKQSKQNHSSNIKSFKNQRPSNEDFLDDNDYCSNNDFS